MADSGATKDDFVDSSAVMDVPLEDNSPGVVKSDIKPDTERKADQPVSVVKETEDSIKKNSHKDSGDKTEASRPAVHLIKGEGDSSLIKSSTNLNDGVKSTVSNAVGGDADSSPTRDDKDYVHPIDDPLEKALKYLAKHDVLQLFQILTANLVYNLPEDPISYMLQEVESIRDLDRLRKGVIKRTSSAKGGNSSHSSKP